MMKRALLGYLAAELLAVIGLLWAFGLGWTLVILAGVFLAGLVLAGSQLRAQLRTLSTTRTDPGRAAADGALVGAGAFLVLLPGVVSTAVGLLMLAPPTRGAMRPLAAGLVARGVARRFGAITLITPVPGRGDYIDGEVVDGDDIDGGYIDGEVIEVEVDRPALR